MNIGIICPSEIALRRFLPAVKSISDFKFAGIAFADKTEWENANDEIILNEEMKAILITDKFGGKLFRGYQSILNSDEIDAIYLPLPPSLHYYWGKQALNAGKNILLEKPFTTSYEHTSKLIEIADLNGLAVHENYMFIYHKQIEDINNIIQNGEIGDVRLYRISFGFPRRATNDFRYKKELGGGALLDAGGYTIKYASLLLGDSTKIIQANSHFIDDFEVDISGTAVLVNEDGVTAQIAFGMDNSYKCDIEVWGSKGSLFSGRILTSPAGFIPKLTLTINNETVIRDLPDDDAFKKSILHFKNCIDDESVRKINYKSILKQAKLVNEFKEKAKIKYYD